MTIHLGTVLGGPGLRNSRLSEELRILKRSFRQLPSTDEREKLGSLDLVFHLPGSLLEPDYVGIRAGKYSKKQRLLMIQVAVPAEKVDAADVNSFIRDALELATDLASNHFAAEGIETDFGPELGLLNDARGSEQE